MTVHTKLNSVTLNNQCIFTGTRTEGKESITRVMLVCKGKNPTRSEGNLARKRIVKMVGDNA